MIPRHRRSRRWLKGASPSATLQWQGSNTQEIIHWRGSNCPYQWRSDPVARSKSQRALWPARRSDTPIDKISREQTPHAQCAPCSSVRRHPRAMLKLGSRIQHSRACWGLATDSQAVRRAYVQQAPFSPLTPLTSEWQTASAVSQGPSESLTGRSFDFVCREDRHKLRQLAQCTGWSP